MGEFNEALHPRDDHGQFSVVARAVRAIGDAWGDVTAHDRGGSHEHAPHIAVHHDHRLSISAHDREHGAVPLIGQLTADDAGAISERLGEAADDVRHGKTGDVSDGNWRISHGDGQVRLHNGDGKQLDLSPDEADALAETIDSVRDMGDRHKRGDPTYTAPLSDGETLVRRKTVSGDDEFHVATAAVDTPFGRRLRLGVTGQPKTFTGGEGPMVAELDEAQARHLDSALESLQTDIGDYEKRLKAANAEWDAWDASHNGHEYKQLSHKQSQARRSGESLTGVESARLAQLQAEADAIYPRHQLVEEGDIFASREISTPWGTVTANAVGWTDHTDVRISVRPNGMTADQWADRIGELQMDDPEAFFDRKKLKALRTAITQAFPDGASITKTEGASNMDTTTYAWAPITKSVKQDDGTLIVYGPASDAGIDRDGQRMNQEWLDKAMPLWKAEGGNIREQHDPKRAVGVAVGLTKDEESGAWLLASHIVDPVAVKKVEAGVLRGYSIGIKSPQLAMGKADAPNGEIVGGHIIETSLADRPSNPRMLFTMAKADGAGELEPVENPTIVESADAGDTEGEPEDADGTKVDEPDLEKRHFSAAERKKDAKSGSAMPDGSFPITDAASLKDAIHLWGNAKDPQAAKRHIIARARALGLVSQLPDDWAISKADALLVDLGSYMTGDLLKYDEADDIAGADQAMALIARLIASEAAELAQGRQEEARDISILLDAHRALSYFREREQQQANGGGDMPDLTYADQTSPQGDSTKTDTPDLVKAAVAEAIKPLEDRAKELEAQLATVKADMAAMPKPGGPVLTKTAPTVAPNANQLRNHEAQELLAKADRTDDPILAAGYRARAAELKAA